jgi:hypothetical protein
MSTVEGYVGLSVLTVITLIRSIIGFCVKIVFGKLITIQACATLHLLHTNMKIFLGRFLK